MIYTRLKPVKNSYYLAFKLEVSDTGPVSETGAFTPSRFRVIKNCRNFKPVV
ncbi:unnamed protein product, partial [Nesidiocoris tenuis]